MKDRRMPTTRPHPSDSWGSQRYQRIHHAQWRATRLVAEDGTPVALPEVLTDQEVCHLVQALNCWHCVSWNHPMAQPVHDAWWRQVFRWSAMIRQSRMPQLSRQGQRKLLGFARHRGIVLRSNCKETMRDNR